MKVRFAVSVTQGSSDADQLADVVDGAARHGFDSLWFADVPRSAMLDPMLAVAFAASRARHLHLGVNLVPFGQQPYVFARRVAQLDQLTGGRLLVTIVPGLDQPGERAALGTTGAHRGRLLDALLPDLRTWWAGGGVQPDDGGDPLVLPQRPRQDPLEVWLGGNGPDAISRTGRLADGWLGAGVTPERADEIRLAIHAAADQADREIDPEHFGLSIAYTRGSGAAALRDEIGRLIEVGLSKFVLRPAERVTEWDRELEFLATAVLDLQS